MNARKAIARTVLATSVQDLIGETATVAIDPGASTVQQAIAPKGRPAIGIVPARHATVTAALDPIGGRRPEQTRGRPARSVSAGRIARQAQAADVPRGSAIGRDRRVMPTGHVALTGQRAIAPKGHPAIGIGLGRHAIASARGRRARLVRGTVLGRRGIVTAIGPGRRVKLGREIGPGRLATGIGRARRAIATGSALGRRARRGRQAGAGSGRKVPEGIVPVVPAPDVRLQDRGQKAADSVVRPRRGRRVTATVRLANGGTTSSLNE